MNCESSRDLRFRFRVDASASADAAHAPGSDEQGGAHADNLITTALRGETGSADLHQLRETTWRMVPVEANS